MKKLAKTPPEFEIRFSQCGIPFEFFQCDCGEKIAWDTGHNDTFVRCPTCGDMQETNGALIQAAD